MIADDQEVTVMRLIVMKQSLNTDTDDKEQYLRPHLCYSCLQCLTPEAENSPYQAEQRDDDQKEERDNKEQYQFYASSHAAFPIFT